MSFTMPSVSFPECWSFFNTIKTCKPAFICARFVLSILLLPLSIIVTSKVQPSCPQCPCFSRYKRTIQMISVVPTRYRQRITIAENFLFSKTWPPFLTSGFLFASEEELSHVRDAYTFEPKFVLNLRTCNVPLRKGRPGVRIIQEIYVYQPGRNLNDLAEEIEVCKSISRLIKWSRPIDTILNSQPALCLLKRRFNLSTRFRTCPTLTGRDFFWMAFCLYKNNPLGTSGILKLHCCQCIPVRSTEGPERT